MNRKMPTKSDAAKVTRVKMRAKVRLSDFLIKGELGRGTYGSVYKALRRGKKTPYAVKVINMKGMTKKQLHDCSEEVRILSSLKNENIVKYLDSFVDNGKLYIVMEFVSNGTLYDFYRSNKKRAEEAFVWTTLIRLTLALQYIHGKKILHRDVKSTNVFLDKNLKPRLGDFGVAKVLGASKKMARTVVGTPFYLSPELCQGRPYNDKSDIWALGIVMYELCMRAHPFVADSPIQLSQKIVGGKFHPISGYSQDVAAIIHKCMAVNPLERPSASGILSLPIVQSKARELGIIKESQADSNSASPPKQSSAAASLPKPSVKQIRKFKFESTIVGVVKEEKAAITPQGKVKDKEDESLVRDLPLYPANNKRRSVIAASSESSGVKVVPVLTGAPLYHGAEEKGNQKRSAPAEPKRMGGSSDTLQKLEKQMTAARASCAEWIGRDEMQELFALIGNHMKRKKGPLDQSDLLKLFKEAHVLSPVIDPEAFVIIYRLHNLENEASML